MAEEVSMGSSSLRSPRPSGSTSLTALFAAGLSLHAGLAGAVVFCANAKHPQRVTVRVGGACKNKEVDVTTEASTSVCTCVVPTSSTTTTTLPPPGDCSAVLTPYKEKFASEQELLDLLTGSWLTCLICNGHDCGSPGVLGSYGMSFGDDGQWHALDDDGAGGFKEDPIYFGSFIVVPPGVPAPSGISTNLWSIALNVGDVTVAEALVRFSVTGNTLELTGALGLGVPVTYVRSQ
jgi:hypothetical protein